MGPWVIGAGLCVCLTCAAQIVLPQSNLEDSAANALTLASANLPSGLTIDPNTGTIGGVIGGKADTGSPYSVTVTATDTTANASVFEARNDRKSNDAVSSNGDTHGGVVPKQPTQFTSSPWHRHAYTAMKSSRPHSE